MTVKRSIQQWKVFDRETVDAFRILLRDQRKQCGIIQAKLAKDLQLGPSNFSRWLHEIREWDWIGAIKYKALVERVVTLGLMSDEKLLTNSLEYLGFSSFFGQDDRHIQVLAANATGHYAVYRSSNFKPGTILMGALEVRWDAQERILSTHERYRAIVDGHATQWPRTGYLCARSDGRLVAISRKNGINEPQIMYLNRPMPTNIGLNPAAFDNMDGLVVDWQGDTCYATPVFIVKVNSGLTPAVIRDYLPRELEKHIVGKLRRRLKIVPQGKVPNMVTF